MIFLVKLKYLLRLLERKAFYKNKKLKFVNKTLNI
jgi:hypothetical protein